MSTETFEQIAYNDSCIENLAKYIKDTENEIIYAYKLLKGLRNQVLELEEKQIQLTNKILSKTKSKKQEAKMKEKFYVLFAHESAFRNVYIEIVADNKEDAKKACDNFKNFSLYNQEYFAQSQAAGELKKLNTIRVVNKGIKNKKFLIYELESGNDEQ